MEQTLADGQGSRAALESLFLASLPEIERVRRFVARRHRLSLSEADDFCSEVNLAIIRADYAVLASFQGRSSLRTYLTTVIQRLFLDYRRKLWGKWRPSAEATRRGALAVRLEILMHRDGLTFEEAVETLRTNFACDEAREALLEIANALPLRTTRKPVKEAVEDFVSVPADPAVVPDSLLELDQTSVRVQATIDATMESLAPQDRIVLRMRFE